MKLLTISAVTMALAAAAPAAAAVVHVDIGNVAYTPEKITAHAGDTVEWKNKDFIAHTATADNKDWDLLLQPNQTKSTTVKKPGTYSYYCKFHPNMKGVIEVSPKP